VDYINNYFNIRLAAIGNQSKFHDSVTLHWISAVFVLAILSYLVHRRFWKKNLYIPNILFVIIIWQYFIIGILSTYCNNCNLTIKTQWISFIIFVFVGFVYTIFSIKSQKFLVVNFAAWQIYFLFLLLNGVNLISRELFQILEPVIISILFAFMGVNVFLELKKKEPG
jgi:hypothetical protein